VTTIVRFRTASGDYALPVEAVDEVRFAADLTPLPTPQPGVAGVMPRGDDVLTVLSILGSEGRHVIVVAHEGMTFGLLVDEVTGVHRVDDALIGPPPHGQDGESVTGVVVDASGIVLLLDVEALRMRLLR
jgi:chemotaxis signal transduction protein